MSTIACPGCGSEKIDTGIRNDPETGALRKRCHCDECGTEFWRNEGKFVPNEPEGQVAARIHPHLIDGDFQSDKYPTTPRGKVPLSVKDPMAQDLLWEYARRRRSVDVEFSTDLEIALKNAGYVPKLRVYTNDEEWYVAANWYDFELLMEDIFGKEEWSEWGPWRELEDERPLTLLADEAGHVANEDTKEPKKRTQSAREWAESNGRGLLATTYV